MRYYGWLAFTIASLTLYVIAPAQETQKYRYALSPAKGPAIAGVWVSSGNTDVHITTEGNDFVIGHNPSQTNLKFTDPALIFDKNGIRLQLKGADGQAVTRPVSYRLANKLLKEMLDKAVQATMPQECKACGGSGKVETVSFRSDGHIVDEVVQSVTCEKCKGTGKVASTNICPCGDGKSLCSCGPACDCDSDYWDRGVVKIRR